MADLFDPLPSLPSESLPWIPDVEVSRCSICSRGFSVIIRRHHCRRCGKVVCGNCSPNKRRIFATDPNEVRVCNLCYAAMDEVYTAADWSGQSQSDIEDDAPGPTVPGLQIGKVYVKVVEAIGLPATESIMCDPFVRVTLTGHTSFGQELAPELRMAKHTKYKTRTLNPRWDESFVFNVHHPRSLLRIEVFNHQNISQHHKLGETIVPLNEIMDQRRHNKWLDLTSVEFNAVGGSSGRASSAQSLERTGRIHVLLHYKFSRLAEFVAHFRQEQDFVYDWPKFKAAAFYNNFWVLLDELWPYLELLWAIGPILSWERPSRSFFWLMVLGFFCLNIRWLPVLVHLVVIGFSIRNYLNLIIRRPVEDMRRSTLEEGGEVYPLPQGFKTLTNKMSAFTFPLETKETLRNVQNHMSWISSSLRAVELCINWEDTSYAAYCLAAASSSCVLHLLVPNQYILFGIVLYLFVMWTVPFLTLKRYSFGLYGAISSLLFQSRLRQSSSSSIASELALQDMSGQSGQVTGRFSRSSQSSPMPSVSRIHGQKRSQYKVDTNLGVLSIQAAPMGHGGSKSLNKAAVIARRKVKGSKARSHGALPLTKDLFVTPPSSTGASPSNSPSSATSTCSSSSSSSGSALLAPSISPVKSRKSVNLPSRSTAERQIAEAEMEVMSDDSDVGDSRYLTEKVQGSVEDREGGRSSKKMGTMVERGAAAGSGLLKKDKDRRPSTRRRSRSRITEEMFAVALQQSLAQTTLGSKGRR